MSRPGVSAIAARGDEAGWTRHLPPEVTFGAGAICELPAACRALEIRRPLVVTDAGLAGHDMVTGALGALRRALPFAAMFSDVEGNPTEGHVRAGAAAYARGDHDGVVALGGGSALDVGKAIAFGATQSRPLSDYALGGAGPQPAARPAAPWIAVPTTAGTGSEVSPSAVVAEAGAHRKRSICHPNMRARRVLCDAELTVGLPPRLTAWVGMDALSHNLEALLSPACDPSADAIALEGLRAIRRHLPRAVRDGGDLEARGHMLAASTMGALAFVKGCGAVHALSHPLSAVYGTHHGLTNAVLLPYVVAFNQRAAADKLAELARAAELPRISAGAVIDWLLALREELGVPPTLAELGLEAAGAPMERLCAGAELDANAPTNPIPITRARARSIYENAWTGRLGGEGGTHLK